MSLMEYLKLMIWAVGIVTGSFAFTHSIVRKQFSSNLGSSLAKLDLRKTLESWPSEFIGLFDSIFSKNHFTKKCLFRSCIFSLLGLIVITLSYFWLNPYDSLFHWVQYMWIDYANDNLKIFFSAYFTYFFLNLFIDYISLLETRYIIKIIDNNPSLARCLILLILDLIATALIFTIFIVLSDLPLYFYYYLRDFYGSTANFDKILSEYIFTSKLLIQKILEFSTSLPSNQTKIDHILRFPYYTTFLTSIWVWLFSLTVISMKIGQQFGGRIWIFISQKLLDIDKKPLLTLGWIGGSILVVLFILLIPIFVE